MQRQLVDDGAIRHRTFSPPLFTFELNSAHCLRFYIYTTLQLTLFTLWNFHFLILIAVVATSQWSKGGMNPSGNANAVAFWLMASLGKIFYLTFCIFVNGQFRKLCFWVHPSSANVDKEPIECVSRIIKKDNSKTLCSKLNSLFWSHAKPFSVNFATNVLSTSIHSFPTHLCMTFK